MEEREETIVLSPSPWGRSARAKFCGVCKTSGELDSSQNREGTEGSLKFGVTELSQKPAKPLLMVCKWFPLHHCTLQNNILQQKRKEHIRFSPDVNFGLSRLNIGEVAVICFFCFLRIYKSLYEAAMLVDTVCPPAWRPITRDTN